MKQVAIIGAGLGGLAASIKLASQGFKVDVYEKNSYPGGKMMPLTMGTYNFDFGPNTMTMPEVFDTVFTEAGVNPRDYFEWIKLDHHTRNIDHDGSSFLMSTDANVMIKQFEKLDPYAAKHYDQYLSEVDRLYRLSKTSFFPRMFTSWQDYLSPSLFQAVLKVRPLEKMNHFHERFFKNPLVLKAFNRYSTYIGSSPYLSPATFAMIGYLEMVQGVYYIKGGNTTLARAMEKLAIELGVTFHFETPVTKIHMRSNRAEKVEIEDGVVHDVDEVIVNGDLLEVYPSLVAEEHRPSFRDADVTTLSPSISAFVIMVGLSKKLDFIHHQVYFSKDYRKEFKELFDGIWPEDPTIYISNSSYTDSAVSPDGDNLFILVNAPPTGKQSEVSIEDYKERIYNKLERYGLPIRKHKVVEKIIGPNEIKNRFHAYRGALYGISSNSLRNSFLRPSNQSKDIKNIYFAGGSTHPGGGSPMVVISGSNVAKHIISQTLS
ncbi:phytoene desaturase family protein [Guptibacillus algicola]|uniref:phytoene desaturase family protein n=1 Tax=Guptibacillus algicola TaxID=225844 RepID=UPI001CD6A6F6|nr:phytoene desaturase family protein [Alkalihalobacillus algicola]MCA0988251.1 phytoene desaturase [Alkalihalobacillus algicola]